MVRRGEVEGRLIELHCFGLQWYCLEKRRADIKGLGESAARTIMFMRFVDGTVMFMRFVETAYLC